MRWIAMLLCLSPLVAQAATSELSVSVISGKDEPAIYNFPLDGEKHELDLRDSHSRAAAFKDEVTKREICRGAEYKTGLLLTLRSLPQAEDGTNQVELIGQVSTLKGIKDGQQLKCGTNQEVSISNEAFSETILVQGERTKAVVIDGKYTVMVKVR